MPIFSKADQEAQLHPSSLCAGGKSILLRNSWPRGPQLWVGSLKMRHDTRCVCLRTTMWQVATSSQPRMEMESGSGELSLLNIQKALGSYLGGRLTFETSGSFLQKQRGSVVVPGSRVEPPGSRCSSGRQSVRTSAAAALRVQCACVTHLPASARAGLLSSHLVTRRPGTVQHGIWRHRKTISI